ncbi:MAG: tyrosine-protein kinase family protein [Burkholderiales bacterium]|nr:tyrosine-protein kinase family protein [Burkholderiales bacterium]
MRDMDMQEKLQDPKYREINLEALRARHIITPHGENTRSAEEFRMIKRPLLDNAFDPAIRNGNLIMVTSALPGEGKTFCTVNLAMSIAMELNRTLLLVAADVSKPSVLRKLGITADRGLLDLLQDRDLNPADVLLKTNIENLTILPSGRHHKKATELLASQAMMSLLQEMAQRYPDRIILFDSPPLLVTTEASVLASHMGQIVMVVEAEKTPQPAVREALSLIDSCEVVGILLNKTTSIPGGSYYGYGYGYGYGQHT